MTVARRTIVDLSVTKYYHCVSRCVRRASLCGEDSITQINYDYRKGWFVELLAELASTFSIGIGAYAIMSNHYHLLLQIDEENVRSWSDREVYRRWKQIHPISAEEHKNSSRYLKVWRERLCSISWFMKVLNESIARRANKEDGCKGRFWEGRFKCQALLDEAAILNCMVYIDLNPVRARTALTPETSTFTSISQRIKEYKSKKNFKKEQGKQGALFHHSELQRDFMDTKDSMVQEKLAQPQSDMCTHIPLIALDEGRFPLQSREGVSSIPIGVEDYINLVDWSGRQIKKGKSGKIPEYLSPILKRIGTSQYAWMQGAKSLEVSFFYVVGKPGTMKKYAKYRNLQFVKGSHTFSSYQGVA